MAKNNKPPSQDNATQQRSSKQLVREQARRKREQERRRNLLLVIAGIAIVAVVAVIGITSATNNAASGIGKSGEGKILGAADAPVVLQDFSDFYCSHCRAFAMERAPELVKEYVDKNLLRIEFKHFPLRPSSNSAHIAAQCAAVQNKFWEYHDLLFKNQQAIELSASQLKQYATDLKLDQAAFDTCLDQKQTQGIVDADSAEGRAKQVNSTPTLFINNERVEGAVAIEQFRAIINSKLQERGITPPN